MFPLTPYPSPFIPPRVLPVIIMQHPHRRRVEIIELPGPRRPHVRPDRECHDQDGQREHHEEDAHAAARVRIGSIGPAIRPVTVPVKVRPSQLVITTVRDEAGIISAATSGESTPSIASVTPSAL